MPRGRKAVNPEAPAGEGVKTIQINLKLEPPVKAAFDALCLCFGTSREQTFLSLLKGSIEENETLSGIPALKAIL